MPHRTGPGDLGKSEATTAVAAIPPCGHDVLEAPVNASGLNPVAAVRAARLGLAPVLVRHVEKRRPFGNSELRDGFLHRLKQGGKDVLVFFEHEAIERHCERSPGSQRSVHPRSEARPSVTRSQSAHKSRQARSRSDRRARGDKQLP